MKKRVSLETLRRKYNDPDAVFFRKGVLDEHKKIIKSKDVNKDIDIIKKYPPIILEILTILEITRLKINLVIKLLTL